LKNNNKKYSFLASNKFCLDEYCLVPFMEQEMELIRKWRNEQIDYLRQNEPLTKDEQSKYYHQVIKKSFYEKKPEMILFSFILKNNCIGYGGFVHIDWNLKKAELSFVLDTNRTEKLETYKKEFSIFLKIILNIGFKQILFHKIFTETFDIRPNTILVLEKAGFVLENRLSSKNYINGSHVDSLFHRILISEYVKK